MWTRSSLKRTGALLCGIALIASLAWADGVINPGGGGGSTSITANSTPLTCSSGTTGVLYQGSSKVQCDSTLTYVSGGPLTLAAGTLSGGNVVGFNASQTWNNGATVFDAPLKVDVTATAQASESSFFDFTSGGTSFFRWKNTSADVLGGISTLVLRAPQGSGSNLIIEQGPAGWAVAADGNANIGLNTGALGFHAAAAAGYYFYNSTSVYTGTRDTGLSRIAAGQVAIGNGTNGDFSGLLKTGNATLTALTTGTNADFLCLSSGGVVLIQASACTISTLRHKPDWVAYDGDALSTVDRLEVGTFHTDLPSRDPNSESLQLGLNAENVARTLPEAAIYEDDMITPKSYRQEAILALYAAAIKELRAEIAALKDARR